MHFKCFGTHSAKLILEGIVYVLKSLFWKFCLESLFHNVFHVFWKSNSGNHVLEIPESLFSKISRTGSPEITFTKDKMVLLKIMGVQLEIIGVQE